MKMLILNLCLFCISLTAFANSKSDYYYNNCRHLLNGSTVPFSAITHTFRKECAPDVLYSWQSKDKDYLTDFKNTPLSKWKYLYAWRTPMGTFGYGSSQIRMKLRNDVKFKLIHQDKRDCNKFKKEEIERTVYVSIIFNGGHEYLLCSKQVLESWSKNTKGSKLESLKEIAFIDSLPKNGSQLYDIYLGNNRRRKTFLKGLDSFISMNNFQTYFPSIVSDTMAYEWNNSYFQKKLSSIGNVEDDEDGVVFYNEGYEDGHFETKVSSPFKLTNEEIESLE